MKPIVWIGGSLDDLKAFPDSARQSAGHQLSKIQHGESPDDWKPMSAIGIGQRDSCARCRGHLPRHLYCSFRKRDLRAARIPEKVPEDVVARRRSRAKALSIDTR
jgi:phage-related protein